MLYYTLLYMMFWSFACAETHVFTYEELYTDLQQYQDAKILEQKKCHESHIHDSYIVIYYENNKKNERDLIQKGIVSMLANYFELAGKVNLSFTSTYVKKKNIKFYDSLLKFLQSAYIVNSWIKNNFKTEAKILSDNKFLFKQDVSDTQKLRIAFKENANIKGEIKKKRAYSRLNNNFILINNCLDSQDDFAFFFKEIYTFEHLVGSQYKIFDKFGCFVFLALKFDVLIPAKSWKKLPMNLSFNLSTIFHRKLKSINKLKKTF
ncbi:hypothetical protein COBT_003456 [Conglomerata obtusa]